MLCWDPITRKPGRFVVAFAAASDHICDGYNVTKWIDYVVITVKGFDNEWDT